jgi:hypothetical protein
VTSKTPRTKHTSPILRDSSESPPSCQKSESRLKPRRFAWAPAPAAGWGGWIERGLVRITTVARLEACYSARSSPDLRAGLQRPPLSSPPDHRRHRGTRRAHRLPPRQGLRHHRPDHRLADGAPRYGQTAAQATCFPPPQVRPTDLREGAFVQVSVARRCGLRSRVRRFESCRGRPCDVARHRGHLEASSGPGCFSFRAGGLSGGLVVPGWVEVEFAE